MACHWDCTCSTRSPRPGRGPADTATGKPYATALERSLRRAVQAVRRGLPSLSRRRSVAAQPVNKRSTLYRPYAPLWATSAPSRSSVRTGSSSSKARTTPRCAPSASSPTASKAHSPTCGRSRRQSRSRLPPAPSSSVTMSLSLKTYPPRRRLQGLFGPRGSPTPSASLLAACKPPPAAVLPLLPAARRRALRRCPRVFVSPLRSHPSRGRWRRSSNGALPQGPLLAGGRWAFIHPGT